MLNWPDSLSGDLASKLAAAGRCSLRELTQIAMERQQRDDGHVSQPDAINDVVDWARRNSHPIECCREELIVTPREGWMGLHDLLSNL